MSTIHLPTLRTPADQQTAPTSVDARSLATRLHSRLRGEVRFDAGARAMYATDASNYRQVPIGVVVPRDEEDVIETVAACRQFGAPILGRGGGTSLAGQCCNVAHVVLGKRDGTAHGGHLPEAHVRPTLEVIISEAPRHLQR
jgi:hypothetical protein